MIVVLAVMWIGAGVLAVFPYLIYAATLRLVPRRPLHLRARPAPTATLVFCAYNEEASLPAKIANLRAIRRVWPALRFRCFVDKSTDRTLELLRAAGDIVTVDTTEERVGKAAGMTRMVAASDTDVMIFTDANVLLDPRSVPRLLAYFSDADVGGVCGTLCYTNPDASDASRTSSAYWRLEERIKAAESACGSTMGADGAIFAVRRALYPAVPPDLLDDFIASMAVIFAGHRLVSVPDVVAYESAVVDSAGEFRRRRRIACRAHRTHRYLRSRIARLSALDLYKYVGHKVIRWYGVWLAILSLLVGTALAVAVLERAVVMPLMLASALAATIGWRLLGGLREAATQLWATALGMVDAWRGIHYQVWSTPAARAAVGMVDLGPADGAARAPLRLAAARRP